MSIYSRRQTVQRGFPIYPNGLDEAVAQIEKPLSRHLEKGF